MPVPCKRDFGLAVDAATVAKRMQNGIAGKANLRVSPSHSAADRRPMVAIIPANHSTQTEPAPLPQATAGTYLRLAPPDWMRTTSWLSTEAGSVHCCGSAQARECCTRSDSCRRPVTADRVRVLAVAKFSRHTWFENKAEFCCILSAIIPAGILRNARQLSRRHAR